MSQEIKETPISSDQTGRIDMNLARQAFADFLTAMGHDVTCDGLQDTPRRVTEAFREMTEGYHLSAKDHLDVTFEASQYDEIVALANISFVSMCEHHLLPFTGKAGVAYIPRDRVVGLSKLARVVDVYAKRLQLQERLTKQIADAIELHLKPKAVAVVIEAEHTCMTCRGALKPGAVMRTSFLTGGFKKDAAARAEALRLLEMR